MNVLIPFPIGSQTCKQLGKVLLTRNCDFVKAINSGSGREMTSHHCYSAMTPC